jgi:hypothetical protein
VLFKRERKQSYIMVLSVQTLCRLDSEMVALLWDARRLLNVDERCLSEDSVVNTDGTLGLREHDTAPVSTASKHHKFGCAMLQAQFKR